MKKRLYALVLTLFLILIPALSLAEGDLIVNGGFATIGEDGVLPESWTLEAWFDADADRFAMAKTDVVRAQCAYIINYVDNDVRLCQSVAVKPNTLYKLTACIKTRDVYSGGGANISVADTLAASEPITGNTEWTDVELVGRTGASQTIMKVYARLGGYGALSMGEAWFDDVSVTEIAEYDGVIADFAPVDYSTYNEAGESETTVNGSLPHMGVMILSALLLALIFRLLYKRWADKKPLDTTESIKRPALILTLILSAAFIVRIVLAIFILGHTTDINCFMAWSYALANDGLDSFYTAGFFADYPPGYMYVLYLTGSIAKLLNLSYGSTAYAIVAKMPGILADVLAGFVIYKFAKKSLSERASLILAAIVSFNPVMAFISGAWGQIDQILTLLVIASIYLLRNKRGILAGLIYGVAILVKPQALMFGPLLATAYFLWIKDDGKKAILKAALGVLAALAAIFVLSLPFKSTQEWTFVIDKILGTATSYPYASIEAFNLFALFGGNWASVDAPFIGLSYGVYGTVFMALGVVAACVMYGFGRKKSEGALYLASAFLIAALFTLGQYMHERYLFPVLLLIAVSFAYYKDKRLFTAFGCFSVSMLLNAMAAFIITDNQSARGTVYDIFPVVSSLITVAGFAYFAWTTFDILVKHRTRPAFAQEREAAAKPVLPASLYDKERLFSKKDKLLCFGLTAVYAVVALLNLGSLTAPENPWYASAGDTAQIEFNGQVTIAEVRFFGGLYNGTADVKLSENNIVEYDQTNDDMFRWKSISAEPAATNSVTIFVKSGSIWLNEIAFFDEAGTLLVPASSNAPELIDEQDEVPETPSYMNGMYFDELYHARTAYEHLNGLSPYENSHPPLGKVFIMLGIAIFGMNAFGWRVIGTLFGVAMVPVLYAFAKRMLKRTDYAMLAAVLFTFDFMHFAQTRIATIDVYAVFFILLMYYFMYRYYTMNFFTDGFKKTLGPLALSGIFFALGVASKWISIYAGGGLAIILFTSLGKRFIEYRRLKACADASVREKVAPYYKYLIRTLLFCCIFFIVVPVVVYLLSYIPYVLSEDKYDLEGIWGVQEFMFSYHSTLRSSHSYESSWWQWPLDLRPIWFYVGYDVPEGYIRTISSFGNPLVWWSCAVGMIMLIAAKLRDKLKNNAESFVILVGAAVNFLPWVLVERCTFVYHYFATVPFIILASVFMLMRFEERHANVKWIKWVKWAWAAAAVVLFIMFYPVISGVECSRAYVEFLEWLPGWTFRGI